MNIYQKLLSIIGLLFSHMRLTINHIGHNIIIIGHQVDSRSSHAYYKVLLKKLG